MKLPDKPTDRFEVTLWEVNTGNIKGVSPVRYVYIANAKWQDIFPKDKDRRGPGAPFVDEWMVYQFGHFNGRMEGWSALARVLDQDSERIFERLYESKDRAIEILRMHLKRERERHVAEIAEIDAAIAEPDYETRERRAGRSV